MYMTAHIKYTFIVLQLYLSVTCMLSLNKPMALNSCHCIANKYLCLFINMYEINYKV